MKIMSGQFPSIEQIAGNYLEGKSSNKSVTGHGEKSFAQVLANKSNHEEQIGSLRFSKHAAGRLSERNIELSDSQINRLNAGMQAAGEKGINESLVMIDQLAFIVNVKNQTVITALDGKDSMQNVFTNIDGAVIA